MEVFNFQPRGEVKRNVQFLDRTIDFDNGAFQVQKIAVNPIITFEMTFEGSSSKLAKLEEFYIKHRKSERFIFNYFGKEYICQFTSNYSPTESLGFGLQGKIIGKVSVTLTMRVINLDADNPAVNYRWRYVTGNLIAPNIKDYFVLNSILNIPSDRCYVDKKDNKVGIPQ